MINSFPHEIAIHGVYFSPLLLVMFIAFVLTLITTVIFNKLRITQFIIYPHFSFLAIMTLHVILIDTFFIKI
ncbi:MAG: DUF1656 domain-containing protein [Epsilonproteobacteria bacterium]|nr:MAG: DUF1656 domain-containing protein [Campylobacterota bacterium]